MMDAAAPVLRAVGALREAQHGDDLVLADPAVAKSLLDAIPAEFATLTDLDIRRQRVVAEGELVDQDYPEESFGQFWDHFWGSLTCSYTEQIPRLRAEVMSTGDFYSDRQWHSVGMYSEVLHPAGVEKELLIPLQAPPGIARRLVFFRGPGRAFTNDERDAAVLLQPHICQALRRQARLSAARRLTARQLQLLELVVAGLDNSAIGRRLGLSPGTVRKHLENTYARLGVTSRTAAAAQAFPDITWS